MTKYFTYGSNMNQKDLNRYCERRGRDLINLKSKLPKVAVLKDFKLDFNYYSTSRGGGAANVEPSPGDHVEGVLFDMSDEDMITISKKEGAPNYYRKEQVTVVFKDGTTVDAVTFIVCKDKKREFTPPTVEYKQIIINGAKDFGLSKRWIKKLESLPSL